MIEKIIFPILAALAMTIIFLYYSQAYDCKKNGGIPVRDVFGFTCINSEVIKK